MSKIPTFDIPYKTTKISSYGERSQESTMNLPVITNFQKPKVEDFTLTSGLMSEASFMGSSSSARLLGIEEELPKTIEEAYQNIDRIVAKPSGEVSKVYKHDQIREIANNLGLLNKENKNAIKSVLVNIVRSHILSNLGITEEYLEERAASTRKVVIPRTLRKGLRK